jgi:hypothetical protein
VRVASDDMPVVVISKRCCIANQQQCCKTLHCQQGSSFDPCHCEQYLAGRCRGPDVKQFTDVSEEAAVALATCNTDNSVTKQALTNATRRCNSMTCRSTCACCMGLPMPSKGCTDPGVLPAVVISSGVPMQLVWCLPHHARRTCVRGRAKGRSKFWLRVAACDLASRGAAGHLSLSRWSSHNTRIPSCGKQSTDLSHNLKQRWV